MATEQDAAVLMLRTMVKLGGYLDQQEAVYTLQGEFGDRFLYYNANGNLAINADVLKAFRKITNDDVVWDKSSRAWRKRETGDSPSRQQD